MKFPTAVALLLSIAASTTTVGAELVLYTGGDVGGVASKQDAIDFCAEKGGTLAPKSDYETYAADHDYNVQYGMAPFLDEDIVDADDVLGLKEPESESESLSGGFVGFKAPTRKLKGHRKLATVDSVLCDVTPSGGGVAPLNVGSGSGDPHFKTWTGDKYDYHGECDLVLVHSPSFAGGKGLRVHIRTTRVHYFSYIERVAVQIGEDVLEFDNDVSTFRINGEKVAPNAVHHKTYFAGYMVRRDLKKAISIRLDDEHHAKIDLIQRKNGFPAVVVDGGSSEIFKGSLGLLGDWSTGKKLARDGATEFATRELAEGTNEDPVSSEFAQEWQVRDDEPMLFETARYPQYPQRCVPPAKVMGARLGLSHAKQQAEEACAHWKQDIEDCIFDVIATRNVMIAAEGNIHDYSEEA